VLAQMICITAVVSYKTKRFLTCFHDDHVQVGAAMAEAASDSTTEEDLTMMPRMDKQFRYAPVDSNRVARPLYIV
jgi:hypothetical protein